MRYLSIPVVAICVLFSLSSAAQDVERPDDTRTVQFKNTFMSYPFAFFASRLKVGYERNIAPRKGLRINIMVSSAEDGLFYGGEAMDVLEGGIEVQPKFYVQKDLTSMKGFYAAPFVTYRYASFSVYTYGTYPYFETMEVTRSASVVNGGYIFGYQHIFPSSFTFDLYAGGGISIPMGNYEYLENGISLYKRGFVPNFGATMGFAF